MAMMALCLSQELPDDVFQQVLAIPDLYKATTVALR